MHYLCVYVSLKKISDFVMETRNEKGERVKIENNDNKRIEKLIKVR